MRLDRTMKFTIVISADTAYPDLPTAVSPRTFNAVDELAAAASGVLGTGVPVIEGTLGDAPTTGYLLVFDLPRGIDSRLGSRIVAINEDRSSIMKTVERYNLAAAIEKHRYFEWRANRDSDRAYGLVGRKDVAAQMAARIVTGPYTSRRYGMIESKDSGDLVYLLVMYLAAYARAGI